MESDPFIIGWMGRGKSLRDIFMGRASVSIFGRKMELRIIWLKASYWIGAIAGFLIAMMMFFPGPLPFSPGKAFFPSCADDHFALRMGGSFILGWSFLLIWADRKPKERKGVLLLSLFPVLTVWAATEVYAVASAGLSYSARLPFWVLQGGLALLFAFSYSKARGNYSKWWSQRA
jgi:hypothetical protein